MRESWINPRELRTAVERRADSVELDRARLAQASVRLEVEAPGPNGVVVRATVSDRWDSAHEALLKAHRGGIEMTCDCGSERLPCSHLVNLARAWEKQSVTPRGAMLRNPAWRDVVGALVARPRAAGTAVPREVLIHWVELEESEGGVWRIALSWRVHRVGSRGIGRGQAVRPEDILRSPEPWVTEADRGPILILQAFGSLAAGRDTKEPVRVGGSLVDPILRALTRVPRVYWARTRSPLILEPRPISVRLLGALRGGRLAVRVEWGEGFAHGEEASALRVVGSSPPWVERGGVLAPVAGVEDGRALVALGQAGIEVPAAELSSFLGSAVPELESRGIPVELEGIEGRSFLVREVPAPRLYLSEEGGALVGTLRFAYGDYEIPAERAEPVLPVGPGSLDVFVRRDMDAEFEATRRLRALGFRMTDPGRFEIEGEEALDFLRKDLAPLAADWELFGQSDLKRYRVTSAPVSLRVRLGADIDWLDVALEAEADGELVPAEDLLRALRRGVRYVRLGSGANALLPSEWLERIGPAVEELGLDTARARLPKYMAPLVEELLEKAPEVEWGDRSAWEGLLAALRTSAPIPAAAVPLGFAGTLRPYQEEGYRWIRFMGALGFGCILADDMGLGKTVQALAVLSAEVEEGQARPNLVVAPTSVVPNWEEEARRFAPGLRVLRHHGIDRKTRVEGFEGQHVVVTSYAVLRRDLRWLVAVDWNYVVLDEAQAIKNAATQTARAARRLKARRRLALTGTPLENHLGELWSQFQFLAPGLLGTERHFSRAFAKPIARGDQEVLGRLRRRISPFVLRRLKTQVARELPEKVESVLLCEMEPAQERLYRSLLVAGRDKVFREVAQKGLAQARFSVLEALLRLRQVCCHPEILPRGLGEGVPSAKFELFRHFVSEVVDEGHRVLVFSQFVTVLQILRRWFEEAGIAHLYLDGRTRDREERVRRFQEDPAVSAFLVSLKAGGSGLNLTGADYVVIYDPWWNPAVETQAADRAHRIGQTRKVFSYKMITRGTVEEKILALQERKRNLTDDLIRTGPAWGTALTEDDLEELFRV